MIKFFKNRVIKSNKGISIIFAIIIIVLMGLAGSVFAYLIASGSITSRSNLLSAEAKYAAKSGVEITLYEIENGNGNSFSASPLSGCPTNPVLPMGVSGQTSNNNNKYLSGNLQGGFLPSTVNYTPTFCAVESALTGTGSNGGSGEGNHSGNCKGKTKENGKCSTLDSAGSCSLYIITSNGFAGGTEREIAAEVADGTSCKKSIKQGTIYVESELPNSN
jgi:hypothetical protein